MCNFTAQSAKRPIKQTMGRAFVFCDTVVIFSVEIFSEETFVVALMIVP